MVNRLVVDLSPDGGASVATWLEGDDLPDRGHEFTLTWPLDDEALEDLAFYLEDFLLLPSAVYGERGQRVQARLPEWGTQVFRAVFGTGAARDAYVRIRSQPGGTRLVFRSSSARMLALPWELMRDPDRPTPLALDLAGVSRSLPAGQLAETVPVPGGKLRVLMVISRPEGAKDVGYQIIARPLLNRLEAVRGEVELVVLRPPTLDNLARTLAGAAAQGRPFQVVHFDGHGVLTDRPFPGRGPSDTFQTLGAEGMLVFEKPGGGAENIPAPTLAQVLKAAKVPVVVLNACQSGAIGKDLEAAIATRLLQEGTASVVAMAYTVYAVAAAEFMAAFYERLFAGDPVSAAVTAGRQRMYARNRRPSRRGDMRLDDWVIPVHYLRRDVSFPQAVTSRSGSLSLDEELDQIRSADGVAGLGELDPVGSFIGRDGLFYLLEIAARLQRVIVLHGPGGTGKTELAKAFGRWWRDTGGVENPGFVFLHSFEPGVASFGLDGMINRIGLSLFGADFARLERAARHAVAEKALTEHRMLLIWDNFETVRSMPDPEKVTEPLDEDGCRELREFLGRLARRGSSAVLITSRSTETWLGDIRRVTIGGLTPRESDQYANYLLEPYPAAARWRAKRAFGELMDWLDGHPLSMRLILPHLETTEPSALLEALRGTTPLPSSPEGGAGRMTSLPASIAYSHGHLAESTRRLLVAVSLFQAVADGDVLAVLSGVADVPERFRGASEDDWRDALEDAAAVGLLTPLGGGMYRIHPALPAYLAAQWRNQEPLRYDAIRETAIRALVSACAYFGQWLTKQRISSNAGTAYAIIGLQRRTLGSMLGYALAHAQWAEAESIIDPLNSYWDARGLTEEADAWASQVRLVTEDSDGRPPALDSPAGSLWLSISRAQGRRQVERFQLHEAEATFHRILAQLESMPPSRRQKQNMMNAYFQLGIIAANRALPDHAEDWYRKALALGEELEDRRNMAETYGQLGKVAQDRGQLDDAEDWFRKALATREELGNQRGMAVSYNLLGTVAMERGQLDDAENWYRKSLTINESLGDKPRIAIDYHQLGEVARQRDQLDEAEDWYRGELSIAEEIGDKMGLIAAYHQLGVIAQSRDRLDDAEDWLRRALIIEQELADTLDMVRTFGQLGSLAAQREHYDQALQWTIRSVALFDEFPHRMTEPAPMQLATLTARLGMAALEECWRQVTGQPLPREVRDYVHSTNQTGR